MIFEPRLINGLSESGRVDRELSINKELLVFIGDWEGIEEILDIARAAVMGTNGRRYAASESCGSGKGLAEFFLGYSFQEPTI